MSPTRRPPLRLPPTLLRPTWAEISLPAIELNLVKIRRQIRRSGAEILFVVKADAYGHGALEIARFAQKRRLVHGFGVASVEEGLALRRAGVSLPVLILGSLFPLEKSYRKALEAKLVPTVTSLQGARSFVKVAQSFRGRSACHLKLETGMSRIGIRWPAARELARVLHGERKVKLEGLYTHLATADSDKRFTKNQLRQFARAVRDLESEGIEISKRHVANSDGLLHFRESHWDMVRPGIAAFGMMPGFIPALSLKTRIVFLKTIPPGTRVGYGSTFRAKARTLLATIPLGYADGFWRSLSNNGEVLIRGRRCPIVGQISMDMATIDVTRLEGVEVGDEVVAIGTQGAQNIRAEDIAKRVGSIPYEVTCRIAARVPRILRR